MEAAGALSLSLLSLIIRLSNIRHSSFPGDFLFCLFLMTHSKKNPATQLATYLRSHQMMESSQSILECSEYNQ